MLFGTSYCSKDLPRKCAKRSRKFNANASRHWGLRNMQERAQRIGAEWKVASAAGRGTEIEAIVPLAADK